MPALEIIPSVTVVTTTGPLVSNPFYTFIRPADVTAYAVGDIIANSVTAGSVVIPSVVCSRLTGTSFVIHRACIRKTGVSVTNASFRIHLFTALPTVVSGDNAAISMSGSASYLGSIDVTLNQVFTDGATGCSDNNLRSINVDIPNSSTVYMLLEARGVYTPVSAEGFTISLDVVQG